MPNINDLFDVFNRQKRKAKANINRRLAQIKEQREAAEGAARGRGGRLDTRTPSERAAAQARKGSENVLASPLGRFLFLGEPCNNFTSSCVESFWYDIQSQIMHVQFLDKAVYGYGVRAHNISPQMASSMFRAKSKGSFIWDNFRIRKTRFGHRVDYALELSPPGGRAWEQTPEAAAEHAQRVAEESNFAARFERVPEQNIGRGEPLMHAPRSRKAIDNLNRATGKIRLPEPD